MTEPVKPSLRISGLHIMEDTGPFWKDDIHVQGGEIFVFLSPADGTGEALHLILSSLAQPLKGEIEWDGFLAGTIPANWMRDGSVEDLIVALAESVGLDRKLVDEYKAEVLAASKLKPEDAKTLLCDLTMQQRAMIGFYLGYSFLPEVLIAAEPTEGCSDIQQTQILQKIFRHSREGNAVVLFTSRTEVAESLGDRIALLYKGRTVALGSREELLSMGEPLDSMRLVFADEPALNKLGLGTVEGVKSVKKTPGGHVLRILGGQHTAQKVFEVLNERGIRILAASYESRNLATVFEELTAT
ncbi:MAG: ATP-binding cassette domain-containing protein [Planctomycetota bacterium]